MISTAFKSDLKGKNIGITPLVIIEKRLHYELDNADTNNNNNNFIWHRLSTHHVTIQDEYYTPLLKDFPKFNHSIDVFTKKYTTPKLSLKIYNSDYNGRKFSEYQDAYNFIGLRVFLYYKTKNCTKIFNHNGSWEVSKFGMQYSDYETVEWNEMVESGCYKAFSGIIRTFEASGETISITVESDLPIMLSQELPGRNLTEDAYGNMPEKYLNKPIPISYGHIPHCPTVAYITGGGLKFISDDRLIKNILYSDNIISGGYTVEQGTNFYNGALSIFDSKMVSLLTHTQPMSDLAMPEFFMDDSGDLTKNEDWYDITGINSISEWVGGVPVPRYPQLKISDDFQSVTILASSTYGLVNRVQGVGWGTPDSISLYRPDVLNIYEEAEQFITDEDMVNILEGTPVLYDLEATTDPVDNWGIDAGGTAEPMYSTPMFTLQWDNSLGYDIFRPMMSILNGHRLPTRGDNEWPNPGQGKWDLYHGWIMCYQPTQYVDTGAGNGLGGEAWKFLSHGIDGSLVHDMDLNTMSPADFHLYEGVSSDDIDRIWNTAEDLELGGLIGYYAKPFVAVGDVWGPQEDAEEVMGDAYWTHNYQMASDVGTDEIFFSYTGQGNRQTMIPFFRFVNGRDFKLYTYHADGGETAFPMTGYKLTSMELWLHAIADIRNEGNDDGDATVTDSDAPLAGISWNFKSLSIMSIVEVPDAKDRDYYMWIEGRLGSEELQQLSHSVSYNNISPEGDEWWLTWTNSWGTGHPDYYLQKPSSIIRDIIDEELKNSKPASYDYSFDEASYSRALWVDVKDNQFGVQKDFSLCVNEKILASKLIEDLSFFGNISLVVKNSGLIGFVQHLSMYSYEMHYNNNWHPSQTVHPRLIINPLDVIKHDFKLTSAEKIVTKSEVSYYKNYAEGSMNSTSSNIYQDEDLTIPSFYGIDNLEKNYKHHQHLYTTDSVTADCFNERYFKEFRTSHITAKLQLPYSYVHFQLGDVAHFPKDELIDGIKAHGIDYTNPVIYGGVFRYPLFMITSVSFKDNYIEFELYQLHHYKISYGNPAPYSLDLDDIVSQDGLPGWTRERFPNMNLIDPAGITPTSEDEEEGLGYCLYDGGVVMMSEDDCTDVGGDAWSVQSIHYGCTDPEALNFDPTASADNGTCDYVGIGGDTTFENTDSFELTTGSLNSSRAKFGYHNFRYDADTGMSLIVASGDYNDDSGWQDLFGPDRWSFGSDIQSLAPSSISGLTSDQVRNFCAIEIYFSPVEYSDVDVMTEQNGNHAFCLRLENVKGSEHDPDFDWSSIMSGTLGGFGLISSGIYEEMDGYLPQWHNWDYQSILYNGEQLGEPWDNYMNYYDTQYAADSASGCSITEELWHQAVWRTAIKLDWVFYQGPPPYYVTWEHPEAHQAHWDGDWNLAHTHPGRTRGRFGTFADVNAISVNGNYNIENHEHPYRVRQNRGLSFVVHPTSGEYQSFNVFRYLFHIKLYPDWQGSPPNMSHTVTYSRKDDVDNEFLLFKYTQEALSRGLLEQIAILEQSDNSSDIKKLKLLKALQDGRIN